MSGPSGAEASGPSGVVRNSALSFVAQEMQTDAGASSDVRDQMTQADRLVPAGLKALCDACSRLYPDQPNPLQVTTRLKYWLGGHDPLDYISMYWNPGKPEEDIPPHWHYVSFGLSDLHGDGRVHPPADRVLLAAGAAPASGYGLELTLRLAGAPPQPPLWPAALLQALSRYIFTTGNKFYAGDHISWHAPLDGGGAGSKSRVRHLLVAEDPQLPTVDTPHGRVSFLQMVGCTSRELRAAQRGSGFDVLKLIAEDPRSGGAWLLTSLSRPGSARGLRCEARPAPACLAGVSARVRWAPWTPQPGTEEPASPSDLSPTMEQLIKDTLQRGLTCMTERSGPEGHMSTDSFEMSSIERALPQIPELMQGSWRSEESIEYLEGIHLTLNAEGASLLPLAIDGRILHDRHFTWREGGRAVTLVSSRVGGALPTTEKPYATKGLWLQILIPKELAQDMSVQVANLSSLADSDSESDSDGDDGDEDNTEPPSLPLTLCWPTHRLKVSVLPDHEML